MTPDPDITEIREYNERALRYIQHNDSLVYFCAPTEVTFGTMAIRDWKALPPWKPQGAAAVVAQRAAGGMLPCPFCSGVDLQIISIRSEEDGRPYARAVFCRGCHCTGRHAERIGWAETDESAVESWNTRAGDQR